MYTTIERKNVLDGSQGLKVEINLKIEGSNTNVFS